jgi:hypothetical protein
MTATRTMSIPRTSCVVTIVMILGLMATPSIPASAAVPRLPAGVTAARPQLHVLGQGELRFVFWKIYDIALYGSDAAWRDDAPYALAVLYARSFTGAEVADEGVKQMRHLGYQDARQLDRWREDMLMGFPEVHPGDQVAAVFSPPDDTRFYVNGRLTADIHDLAFSHAFFGIWLDPQTDAPGLRRALLGQD